MQLARRLVPVAVKKRLRTAHRRYTLRKAMRAFRKDPARAAQDESVLQALVYGWGNEGWSADTRYLAACARSALQTSGPILECGSGLSTIIVGLIAQHRGFKLWSLEHHEAWAQRVGTALQQYGIHVVELCVTPIVRHGEFDWYDVPLERMPKDFSLIVCDGPPADTRGGRYGLVPVMQPRLASDWEILLDDIMREEEQRIAHQWAAALGGSVQVEGPYARIGPLASPEDAPQRKHIKETKRPVA